MKQQELKYSQIDNYYFGANYCRKDLQKGGVSIFL
jgi:hypothetical protein